MNNSFRPLRVLCVVLASLGPALPLSAASDEDCVPECGAPSAPAMTPPPANPAPVRRRGSFIRGPATGAAASEANSVGLRGITLHIPEMRISLPTVELPSLVRFRRGPEFLFDDSRGTFREDADVTELGQIESDEPLTPAPVDTAAPADTPDCAPAAPASPACEAPNQRCAAATQRPLRRAATGTEVDASSRIAELEAELRIARLEAELSRIRAASQSDAAPDLESEASELATVEPQYSTPARAPQARKSAAVRRNDVADLTGRSVVDVDAAPALAQSQMNRRAVQRAAVPRTAR